MSGTVTQAKGQLSSIIMDNQEHTNSNYNRLIVLRLYTCVRNYNTKRSVNITKARAFFERSTIVLRLRYVNFLLVRTVPA